MTNSTDNKIDVASLDSMEKARFTLELGHHFVTYYNFTPDAAMSAANVAVEALIKHSERASEQAEKNRQSLKYR